MKIEKIVADAERGALGIENIAEQPKSASAKQVRLLFHELSELAKIVGVERARSKKLEIKIAELTNNGVPF
jgi:hypothetical protein